MATTSKSAAGKVAKPAAKPKAAPAKAEAVAVAKPKTTKTPATPATALKIATKPKAAAPAKKVAAPAVAVPKQSPAEPRITPQQYRAYVEVAAYHIAERRGFVGGNAMEDWAQAEAEVDRLLSEGILKP